MMPAQAYWMGINREDPTAFWAWLDGLSSLSQTASNTPFTHWSWNMGAYTYDSTKTTWNCVQASRLGDALPATAMYSAAWCCCEGMPTVRSLRR
jgi:hypothetical protein